MTFAAGVGVTITVAITVNVPTSNTVAVVAFGCSMVVVVVVVVVVVSRVEFVVSFQFLSSFFFHFQMNQRLLRTYIVHQFSHSCGMHRGPPFHQIFMRTHGTKPFGTHDPRKRVPGVKFLVEQVFWGFLLMEEEPGRSCCGSVGG